ncbi:hypothetical protein DB346_21435 [Verrucomicrobia bacterium LW23]|nr:hypothetical protein DB346_21435 [Verrucomicrobia bacterium LW23]
MVCPCAAQTTEPTALGVLPDSASWTVKYGDRKVAPTGELHIVEIQISKSGGTRHTVTTYGNGLRGEVWFTNYTFLTRKPGEPDAQIRVMDVDPIHPVIPLPTDFEDLAWVVRSTFVKKGEWKGRAANVYDRDMKPGAETPPGNCVAWIDSETRLPLAVREDGVERSYHFTPFSGPLELPAAFLVKLDEFKKQVAADAIRRRRIP